MDTRWSRWRQARRITPGDGRPMPRFRWWQIFSRSVFAIDLRGPDGRTRNHCVDVCPWGDRDDGEVRARLYVDGALELVSRVPAGLPVPGGRIEVAVGSFGMKRCHHVGDDGTTTPLTPHPRSAEGRRARLDRAHPTLSRAVGAVSLVLVLVGLCLALPPIIEPVSQIPPIADSVGTFESPVDLPLWLDVTLGSLAVLGSVERALRLRSTWIDDLAS